MTRTQDRKSKAVPILDRWTPRLHLCDAKTTRDSAICSFRGAWGGWDLRYSIGPCSLYAPTLSWNPILCRCPICHAGGYGNVRVKQQYTGQIIVICRRWGCARIRITSSRLEVGEGGANPLKWFKGLHYYCYYYYDYYCYESVSASRTYGRLANFESQILPVLSSDTRLQQRGTNRFTCDLRVLPHHHSQAPRLRVQSGREVWLRMRDLQRSAT